MNRKDKEKKILDLLTDTGFTLGRNVNMTPVLSAMPAKQITAITGFINYCRNEQSPEYVCGNIMHDIVQFINNYCREYDGSTPRIGSQYLEFAEDTINA